MVHIFSCMGMKIGYAKSTPKIAVCMVHLSLNTPKFVTMTLFFHRGLRVLHVLPCFSPPARWGLLDFIRAVLCILFLLLVLLLLAVQIPVGTAGPPPQAPDPSQRTARPPPRAPDPSGHCRTSTATSRWQWALPDLNCQIECQKICQIECQKICQIECQKICQIECHSKWSIFFLGGI